MPSLKLTRKPITHKATKWRYNYSPATSLASKSPVGQDLRRPARRGGNETHTKTGVEDVL